MDYAQPKLKYIPPQFNLIVSKIVHYLLRLVVKYRINSSMLAGVDRIETENVEKLVDLYQKFQDKKVRFIIAIRHCELEDPFLTLYLVARILPRVARQLGVRLKQPVHSHFLYDRGIALWGGKWLGWLFARMGGIPVRRGKAFDLKAMRTIRDILANSQFPLGLAPEGATNGQSEQVSEIEPGAAQLGFWCLEDLKKADRDAEVYIVPIGIQYSYIDPSWESLEALISNLEIACGIDTQIDRSQFKEPEKLYYQRLFALGEYLLDKMEQFYHRFYHRKIAKPSPEETITPNEALDIRLENLRNTALEVAEDYFKLNHKGNRVERCRKIEEAAWNYIYREDISELKDLSPVEKGLADWVAQEAMLRLQHMRLVENFISLRGSYILEKPSFDRCAETALLIFNFIGKIQGERAPSRPQLAKRMVKLTVCTPISVNQKWETYRQSRQAAKRAVTNLTADIHKALENTIS